MTSKPRTFTSMERTPDSGYDVRRLQADGGHISPASDPLNALTTQELVSLGDQLNADTATQAAYWGKYTRTQDEV